jgi:hypothetical protein
MSFLKKYHINDYIIIEKISEGSICTVYKVIKDRITYALKRFKKNK